MVRLTCRSAFITWNLQHPQIAKEAAVSLNVLVPPRLSQLDPARPVRVVNARINPHPELRKPPLLRAQRFERDLPNAKFQPHPFEANLFEEAQIVIADAGGIQAMA